MEHLVGFVVPEGGPDGPEGVAEPGIQHAAGEPVVLEEGIGHPHGAAAVRFKTLGGIVVDELGVVKVELTVTGLVDHERAAAIHKGGIVRDQFCRVTDVDEHDTAFHRLAASARTLEDDVVQMQRGVEDVKGQEEGIVSQRFGNIVVTHESQAFFRHFTRLGVRLRQLPVDGNGGTGSVQDECGTVTGSQCGLDEGGIIPEHIAVESDREVFAFVVGGELLGVFDRFVQTGVIVVIVDHIFIGIDFQGESAQNGSERTGGVLVLVETGLLVVEGIDFAFITALVVVIDRDRVGECGVIVVHILAVESIQRTGSVNRIPGGIHGNHQFTETVFLFIISVIIDPHTARLTVRGKVAPVTGDRGRAGDRIQLRLIVVGEVDIVAHRYCAGIVALPARRNSREAHSSHHARQTRRSAEGGLAAVAVPDIDIEELGHIDEQPVIFKEDVVIHIPHKDLVRDPRGEPDTLGAVELIDVIDTFFDFTVIVPGDHVVIRKVGVTEVDRTGVTVGIIHFHFCQDHAVQHVHIAAHMVDHTVVAGHAFAGINIRFHGDDGRIDQVHRCVPVRGETGIVLFTFQLDIVFHFVAVKGAVDHGGIPLIPDIQHGFCLTTGALGRGFHIIEQHAVHHQGRHLVHIDRSGDLHIFQGDVRRIRHMEHIVHIATHSQDRFRAADQSHIECTLVRRTQIRLHAADRETFFQDKGGIDQVQRNVVEHDIGTGIKLAVIVHIQIPVRQTFPDFADGVVAVNAAVCQFRPGEEGGILCSTCRVRRGTLDPAAVQFHFVTDFDGFFRHDFLHDPFRPGGGGIGSTAGVLTQTIPVGIAEGGIPERVGVETAVALIAGNTQVLMVQDAVQLGIQFNTQVQFPDLEQISGIQHIHAVHINLAQIKEIFRRDQRIVVNIVHTQHAAVRDPLAFRIEEAGQLADHVVGTGDSTDETGRFTVVSTGTAGIVFGSRHVVRHADPAAFTGGVIHHQVVQHEEVSAVSCGCS